MSSDILIHSFWGTIWAQIFKTSLGDTNARPRLNHYLNYKKIVYYVKIKITSLN